MAFVGGAFSFYFNAVYKRKISPQQFWIPNICQLDASNCISIVDTKYGRIFGASNAQLGFYFLFGYGLILIGVALEIEGREIETIRCGDGVVWFNFKTICSGPRGVADYIELARQFQTVLISNIPVMNDNDNDMLKRFITLVDEFYDRNVKLIITAENIPKKLYRGKLLVEPFKRTKSRLEEMRTHDYLAREHLP